MFWEPLRVMQGCKIYVRGGIDLGSLGCRNILERWSPGFVGWTVACVVVLQA